MTTLRRALVAATGGPHYTGWNTAQKIDEIGGNDPGLNTPSSTAARSSRRTG